MKTTYFLLLLFICSVSFYAQSFYSEYYTENNGLPSSSVYDAEQGNDGKMYFATRKGIVVYDAYDWKLIPGTSYRGQSVTKLKKEKSSGRIWGMSDGQYLTLFSIRKDSAKVFRNIDSSITKTRRFIDFDILPYEDNVKIAAISKTNLFYYHGNTWSELKVSGGKDVNYFCVSRFNKQLYIGTSDGVYIITQDGKFTSSGILPGEDIYNFDVSAANELFVYAESGIYKIYDNNPEKVLDSDSIKVEDDVYFYPFLADFQGIYIYGKEISAYFHDTRRDLILELNDKIGLSVNGATAVFRDRENNIWITNRRGITKYNAFSILNFHSEDGMPEDEVAALENAGNGYIVAGHHETFSIFRDYRFIRSVTLKNPDNLYFRILDISRANDGKLWYAAEKYGFGYLDRNFNPHKFSVPSAKEFAYSVLPAGKDSVFFLTKTKLILYTNNSFTEIPVEKNITDQTIFRKIFNTGQKYPTVASVNNGIYLYDENSGEYKTHYSPSIDDSRNIYSVSVYNNNLYAGSSAGLYVLDNDTLKSAQFGTGKINRPVYFSGTDNYSNFWIGTDFGTYKWDGVRLMSYNISDGLSGLETNRDAFVNDDKGNIWIGTSQGLSVVDHQLDSVNIVVPQLIFDGLETNIRSIKLDKEVVLNKEDGGFFVSAKNISYVHKNDVEFKVNLEGFDNEWYLFYMSDPVPYAPFYDLEAGEYKLHLKMYIGINDEVQSITSDPVIIENRFYDTFEFRALIVFGVLCIMVLVILYMRKNIYTGKLEKEYDKSTARIRHNLLREEVIFRNNKTVMLFIEPKNSKIIEVNKSAVLFYGINEEEFLNYKLSDIEVSRQDYTTEHFQGDSSVAGSYEAVHRAKGGREVDVEVIFSILPHETGPLYFLIINDISVRKQAEIVIRESEEKYRTLISNMQDGIFLIQEGKTIFINQSISDILGYQRHELINKPFIKFIAEDDRERILNIYGQRLRGESVVSEYELKLIGKNNKIIYGNVHVGTLVFENKPTIMGTLKDITAKKASDENLRVLSTIVEQSPVSIMLTDSSFKVTYLNPVFTASTGYTLEKIQDNIFNYMGLNDREMITKIRQKLLTGIAWTGELINVRSDGEKYWASMVISPIKNDKNEITNYVFLENDISFEKYAVEELRKNEKLLTSVLDNLPVTLMVIDLDGIITIYKSGKLNHADRGNNVAGNSVFELFRDNEEIIEDLNRAFHGERFTSVREYNNNVNETHYSTLTDGSGKISGIISISYNVNERVAAAEALLNAKEEAEKSDKLKSEFLAQVSHEIRTPINSILSFASLIKEDIAEHLNEDLIYGFNVIENGGMRLIRTIDLILNMSQIQTQTYTPKIEKINLIDDVFTNLVSEMKYIAGKKGLTLEFVHECEKCSVLGDKYTIYQIFNNLTDNAIKYTEYGYIKIRLFEENGFVAVAVEDSGIGMTPEFIKEIFRPFTQEETGYTRKYEGNGLGMALVKEYADLNNAKLEIESEKGKGTSIKVIFSV